MSHSRSTTVPQPACEVRAGLVRFARFQRRAHDQRSRRRYRLRAIHHWVRLAAFHCGYDPLDLLGPSRLAGLCRARWVAMQLLYEDGWSQPRIAALLGRTDHTTVRNGLTRVAGDPWLIDAAGAVRALWRAEVHAS